MLKSYAAENIGIFGYSAGGVLTAQAVNWFQVHELPRPGAIGIFGAGALIGGHGISNPKTPDSANDIRQLISYIDVDQLELRSPLISP